ncbi:hypothetical protein [Amycolatopsis solani]|uniref:hypothetical protein n=1 Tax=Amycolatopsis solani TaxID=3028615 RepID=UPI0025B0BE39|nr:hypothetical protein [Amycolatopsis sp. MEP2-6]
MTDHEQPVKPGFVLDTKLVKKFVAGELDEAGQAELAGQVALIAVFHAELPTALAAQLTRIVRHLGGDAELVRWLDRFPGRPRIVARMFALIDLLDTVSAEPAVVTALAELRAGTRYPPGLAGYLSPDTDDETLAGLAWHIERLAADDRMADAVRLARNSVALVQRIAARARELKPDLPDLAGLAAEAGKAVDDAADEAGLAK